MASLPSDRTKLALAQNNQNPQNVLGSSQNKNAITEAYDTIDLLNQKVDGLVGSTTLSPYPPAQYNQLINGNFDVWSRGVSFATPGNNFFTADRWSLTYDGTIGTFTVSLQGFPLGQTSVPNNPRYFMRWSQTVAGSASNYRLLRTAIEGVHTFSGQKCTLSFWAKADIARTIPQISFRQSFGTGGTPSSSFDTNAGAINLTTSWQKFTVTVTLPNISGKTLGTNNDDNLSILFYLPVNTTMNIDMSEVQINEGGIALPFQPRSTADEQNLSFRYNQRFGGGTPFALVGVGEAVSATQAYIFVPLKVRMRTIPTISNGGGWKLLFNNTNIACTGLGIDINQSTTDFIAIVATVASGLTVGATVLLQANNDTTAYINFDAEI